MEKLCVKSGTSVEDVTAEVVEISPRETLTNRFLMEETPKKNARPPGVFKRLLQDTEMRKKKTKEPRPAIAPPAKKASGPRIELELLRKHAESKAEMEQLKAKWHASMMKEVLPAPQISDYSRTLAQQVTTYNSHLRCYIRSQFGPPPFTIEVGGENSEIPVKENSEDEQLKEKSSEEVSPEVSPLETEEVKPLPSLEAIEEEPAELEERGVQTEKIEKRKKRKKLGVRLTPISSMSAEPVESSGPPQVSKSSITLEDARVYQAMVKRHADILKTPLGSSYYSMKYW